MMMLFLIVSLDMLHTHGMTEGILPRRAMPLGVDDRTAYLFTYLFILIVLCMQYLVFWILEFGFNLPTTEIALYIGPELITSYLARGLPIIIVVKQQIISCAGYIQYSWISFKFTEENGSSHYWNNMHHKAVFFPMHTVNISFDLFCGTTISETHQTICSTFAI